MFDQFRKFDTNRKGKEPSFGARNKSVTQTTGKICATEFCNYWGTRPPVSANALPVAQAGQRIAPLQAPTQRGAVRLDPAPCQKERSA